MARAKLTSKEDHRTLVGDDGELLEADSSVNPGAYAQYVAEFNPLPRQHLNEWDSSRITEYGVYGCLGFLLIYMLMGGIALIQWFQRIAEAPR